MVLHLDPNFKPTSAPEIYFESFTFSGGEPHIKIVPFAYDGPIAITHRLNSFNDLGLLLIAVDALKRMGKKDLSLIIPYFPGARQDRVMTAGESLSVKVYAQIINDLQLTKVTIFDPHSDVTQALLDNCTVISNHEFIKTIMTELPSECLLISPDAGAAKKIHKLAKYLQDYEVVECGKDRDVRTGQLSGFKVPISDLRGRPCLIVDDICDGGGTFIGLATELKKANAGDLYLAVSHGIFSRGLTTLKEVFKGIYTTDSIKEEKQLDQVTMSQLI